MKIKNVELKIKNGEAESTAASVGRVFKGLGSWVSVLGGDAVMGLGAGV